MLTIRKCFPLAICAVFIGAASEVSAQNPQVAVNTGETVSSRAVILETRSEKPLREVNRIESLDLSRVGVQTAQPLPLSLVDALRKALEANNTIEISRGDVRFQETQVRALLGFYDPVLTVTPTFTRNSTTGEPTATHDFRVNSNISQFIKPGGGNYQVFFNNLRTENRFAQQQATSGNVIGGLRALYSSGLGVTYSQPLLRNFAIDSTRRSIRSIRASEP